MKKSTLIIVGILFLLAWGAVPTMAQNMGVDMPIPTLGDALDAITRAFQWVIVVAIQSAAALTGTPLP